MNSQTNYLQVVLDRVACSPEERGAYFCWDEVRTWPSGALDALLENGFLQPAQPMSAVVCDGCEENCSEMPVNIYPAQDDRSGRAFIVCDKRDDIGHIRVSFQRMTQWQSTGEHIATGLGRMLGLAPQSLRTRNANQWNIGALNGRRNKCLVSLTTKDGLVLSLAGHSISLIEVLTMSGGAITLDREELIRLVDEPGEQREAEPADERRARLRGRVSAERKKGTRAFLKLIAAEEAISVTRLKQLIHVDRSPPVGLAGLITSNIAWTSSTKRRAKY